VAKSIISRPVIFAVVIAAVLAAFAAAGWSLFMAGAGGAGGGPAGPLVIASDRADLPDALADAPFVAANDRSDVWILVKPGCPDCEKLQSGLVAKLIEQGVGVHVMVVLPREDIASPAIAAGVAQIAARKDWTMLLACYPRAGAGCETGALEPEAEDGYLEWGRASLDRIEPILAANDASVAFPMAFWRAGREWRAALGDDAAAWASLSKDVSR
jgi:hypothetical protein